MKTIKYLLIVAVSIFSMTTLKAQVPGLSFGIKAGANFANLHSDFKELSKEKGKLGFNIGVFARVGETLYFQPEINYTTFKSEYSYGNTTYSPNFKQMNIPLMVGYKLINKEAFNLHVSAGPDFSYTLNKPNAPLSFDYKKFNIGGVINAGVDIGSLTIDARYTRGFTKINKGLNEKTGIYNLSVGFKIF
ncbi:porin family protein [Pedobacter caeni]|nr:porin family protein [Pedobacter caeni]